MSSAAKTLTCLCRRQIQNCPITAGISGVIWIFGDKVVMTPFPRGKGWELPYVILTEETRLS